jgi:hypothetical protein
LRAITLLPGVPNSARLEEIPEPAPNDGAILARWRDALEPQPGDIKVVVDFTP